MVGATWLILGFATAGLLARPLQRPCRDEDSCRKACIDEPPACRELGRLLLFGLGGRRDVPAAREILQKSCDGGDGRACGLLAYSLYARTARREDPDRALPLYKRGCDLGDPESCLEYGHMVKEGVPGEPDRKLGTSLIHRACRNGSAFACVDAGEQRRSAEILSRSCDAGGAPECSWLSEQLGANGGREDARRRESLQEMSLSLDRKACDENFVESCFVAGLSTGSNDLLRRACELGSV